MNLLTQQEVAALLRCSVSKIERLRRDGSLPYLPGRPVMIELADVLAYVERLRKTTWLKSAKPNSRKTTAATGKSTGPSTTASAGGPSASRRGRRTALMQSLFAKRGSKA